MTKFAESVSTLLELKNLRKSDIVNTLGISDSTVRSWWGKDSLPSIEVGYKVAKYLGVTVEYLLTGEDSKEKEAKNAPKKDTLTEKIGQLTEAQREEIEDLVDVKIAKNEEKEQIAKAI